MSSSAADAPLQHRGTRSEVFAFALYDWANSAWSTILITVVVFYLTTVVAPNDWGPWFYGNGVGVSMFIAALLSPVLGALADARATKRYWLAITALGGAGAAVVMGLVPTQPAWIAITLFFLANLGFELSYGICNGFLPEISNEKTVNRVSAWAFGAGYVGGGLALALALVVLMKGSWFGLPDGNYLTCDYNAVNQGTFAVDVTPGNFDVKLLFGDPAAPLPEIEYQVADNPPQVVSAERGEVVERAERVTVAGDRLAVALQAIGAADNEVKLVALEVVGRDVDFAARFDFGTRGSPVESGYIPVDRRDAFAPRNLQAEKKLNPEDFQLESLAGRYASAGESAAPGQRQAWLGFGWQSGKISDHDAVNPLRMRIGLLIGGVWWGLFSIPTVLILRDKVQPRAERQSLLASAQGAFGQVYQTLRHVRLYPTLALFLLGFLFFNDGMQTVISQASVFAQRELKMTTVDLVPLILVIQFVSLPGALFVGWLSDRIGQKVTLLLTLAIWIGLIFSAFFVTTKAQFWVMGLVLAMVMGGAQSVSRAIMGTMTPATRAAEFMGFFNFSGKATSVFGPMLFANTLRITGSAHWAILSLLVFFVVGTLLVLPVNVARGQREAFSEA